MKKALSATTIFIFFFAAYVGYSLIHPQAARAAKLSDGTWTGTDNGDVDVTITFTISGAIDDNDYVMLTFPTEAPVDDGTDITCTDDAAGFTCTRLDDQTDDTIKVTNTSGSSVAGGSEVIITMTDAIDTAYDGTVYAIQSMAVNTNNSDDSAIDYGLALISNDNSSTSYKTDITATVPLFLTMAVDTNTINFGTLSVSSVKELDQTYTFNSNYTAGIQVQIAADDDLNNAGDTQNINNVSDGTVTAGSEEYGISVDNLSGMSADSPYDSGDDLVPNPGTTPASPDDIVNSTGTMSSATFDINYKAAISGTTPADTYTQEVTITIATN